MSEQDRKALYGDITFRLVEAKRGLGDLEARASLVERSLRLITAQFRTFREDNPALSDALDSLPSGTEIKALLSSIDAAWKDVESLRRQLKELGA